MARTHHDLTTLEILAVASLAALSASKAVVTDSSGLVVSSVATATEVGYLSGVTSALQTQLDGKANTALSNLSSVAINTSLLPGSNDGAALGSGTLSFSDLYLAAGGIINWGNGTSTITQADGTMTYRDDTNGGETAFVMMNGSTTASSVMAHYIGANTSTLGVKLSHNNNSGAAQIDHYTAAGDFTIQTKQSLILMIDSNNDDTTRTVGIQTDGVATNIWSVSEASVMTLGYSALTTASTFTITSRHNAAIYLDGDTDNDGSEQGTAFLRLSQDGANIGNTAGTVGWLGLTQVTDTLPDGTALTGTVANDLVLGTSTGAAGISIITSSAAGLNGVLRYRISNAGAHVASGTTYGWTGTSSFSASVNSGNSATTFTTSEFNISTTDKSNVLNITGVANQAIVVTGYSDTAGNGPNINASKARGTTASPTAVQSGDVIVGIYGRGYEGTTPAFGANYTAAFRILAATTFTSTDQATSMEWGVTASGAVARTIRMVLSSAGRLTLGTTDGSGSGALVVGSATVSSLACSGAVTGIANSITFAGATATSYQVQVGTSDGTDSSRLQLAGGGAPGVTRGAYMNLHGNEHATNPGCADILAGFVTGGYFRVYTGNTALRLTIDDAGLSTFTGGITSTSATNTFGNTTISSGNITFSTTGTGMRSNTSLLHVIDADNNGSAETWALQNGAAANIVRFRQDGLTAWQSAATLGESVFQFVARSSSSTIPDLRFENTAGSTADAVVNSYQDSSGTALLLGSNVYLNTGSLTRFNTSGESAYIYINRTGQIDFGCGASGATATVGMSLLVDNTLSIAKPCATLSTSAPGTTKGGVHFAFSPATDDNMVGITFAGSGNANAQAGIYVQSSGSYGTKMYLATTNSFATGAQTFLAADHEGCTSFTARGTTTRAMDITADSITTGSVLRAYSNSSSTGTRNIFSVVNDNTAAVNVTPINIQQDAVVSTNFKRYASFDGVLLFVSDGTDPNGALTGVAGALCLNGPSGTPYKCTSGTTWVALV